MPGDLRELDAFGALGQAGESSDVLVSLTRGEVVSRRVLDPLTDGQLPIINEDFAVADQIVRRIRSGAPPWPGAA